MSMQRQQWLRSRGNSDQPKKFNGKGRKENQKFTIPFFICVLATVAVKTLAECRMLSADCFVTSSQ